MPRCTRRCIRWPIRPGSNAIMGGDVIRKLVGEFDRAFPDVTRTREILVLAEERGAG